MTPAPFWRSTRILSRSWRDDSMNQHGDVMVRSLSQMDVESLLPNPATRNEHLLCCGEWSPVLSLPPYSSPRFLSLVSPRLVTTRSARVTNLTAGTSSPAQKGDRNTRKTSTTPIGRISMALTDREAQTTTPSVSLMCHARLSPISGGNRPPRVGISRNNPMLRHYSILSVGKISTPLTWTTMAPPAMEATPLLQALSAVAARVPQTSSMKILSLRERRQP